MAEVMTLDIGRTIRNILKLELGFMPGPMVRPCLRMHNVAHGRPYPEWVIQRMLESERLHRECVSAQTAGYIYVVLVRFSSPPCFAPGKNFSDTLGIWSSIVVTAAAIILDKDPGIILRAHYMARTAAYILDKGGLDVPVAVEIKSSEVPKAGQPGLMRRGVGLVMERKIVAKGVFEIQDIKEPRTCH